MIKVLTNILMVFLTSACAKTNINTVEKLPSSIAEIAGDWDVVSFNDFQPIRLNYEGKRNAYVNISDKFIGLRMTCNYSGIAALLTDDGRLVKNPEGSNAGMTAMGCPNAQREKDFMAMMYDSPLVEILPNGRLRLSTKQHEVIIERSETRRLANAPMALDEITGEWHVAFYRGRDFWKGSRYAKKTVSITNEKIQYGDCSPSVGRPRLAENAILYSAPIRPLPEEGNESCKAKTDIESKIIHLLQIAPEVEWTMLRDLRLATDREVVVLTKDENW